MESVLAVLLGVAFLHAFFRTVEAQWPTSYLTLTSGAAYAISQSPLRYLAFRFGPIFVVGSFSAVTLDRAGHDPTVAVLATAGVHACLTSFRAAVGSIRRRAPRRWALLVMHFTVSIGIVCTAVAATATRESISPLVPELSELAATFWTGLAAAVVGAYLIQVSSGTHLDTQTQLQLSRNKISDDLWEMATAESTSRGIDPLIVQALLLTENIQRPKWFRRLENTWGRLGGSGSFGILQIRTSDVMTDEQSVLAALDGPLAGANLPVIVSEYAGGRYERKDFDQLARLARLYNPSTDYVDLVDSAYRWAEYDAERQSAHADNAAQ